MTIAKIGVIKRTGPTHQSTVQKLKTGTSCLKCGCADICPVYDPKNLYGYCGGFMERGKPPKQISQESAQALLLLVDDLLESADYWSEYDVPIGIVARMKAAVKTAKGE